MNERHCEYCGQAAASTSPGGLQACALHQDQPGTTPLYDINTGAPLQTIQEWTRERRAAQWKAQAEGNSRVADMDRRNRAKFNTGYRGCGHGDCQRGSIGIDHSGVESCQEHWVSSSAPDPDESGEGEA